jgi:RND family efflux transporter MFP subunit
MKNTYYIIVLTLILTACSGTNEQSIEALIASGNTKDIQTKKEELVNQQQALVAQIKQLDAKLESIHPDRNIPLITTIVAKSEKFMHYLELQGSVETKENLVITPEMSGILTSVYVKEGDKVSKGQVLAKIDDGGLSQQYASAKIQANLLKTTFDRQKRLWDQKIGSEIQYLQAKSSYESAVESVDQVKQQLAKSNIRAPFTGVIDDVITEKGNVVIAGQTELMRIVNLSDMYIETDVPEDYLTSISNGKDVEVLLPVLGKKINAKIRQTGNFINPANRTFKVEIAVPNKEKTIKPNLTARLRLNDYSNENAILIPQSIISENADGEQYIYILEKKEGVKATAKQLIIETGKTQGDKIEIISGLNVNDEIVKEGARSIKDGQTVKIIYNNNSNALKPIN